MVSGSQTAGKDTGRPKDSGIVRDPAHKVNLFRTRPVERRSPALRRADNALVSEPSIILLSGVGGSLTEWERVSPALAPFGRVVTTPPSGGALIVVGHSQGGVRSLQLASDEPDRVRALVLTSSFFPPARGSSSLARATLDYAGHRLAYARELRRRDHAPHASRAGFGQLRSVARLGVRPSRFHQLADSVVCPVLVIHGTDDHVVPVTFAQAALTRHPAWTYRQIPRAGHHPHRDQPKVWAGIVSEWLGRLSANGLP
jgi:pimeloyl-ACP methyl ester carboxylesterase